MHSRRGGDHAVRTDSGSRFFVPVLRSLARSLRRTSWMSTSTIFLLSPAHSAGNRAKMLLRNDAAIHGTVAMQSRSKCTHSDS